MATLEKIRQRAVLVSVVVAVALFIFIIESGLSSGRSFFADSKQVVLAIGSEKVKYDEYSNRLKMMEDNFRQSGQAVTDDQQMRMNNQLAQSYIASYATNMIADELGMTVSDDELSALIYGSRLQMSPLANQFFSSIGLDASNPEAITQFLKSMTDDSNPSEIKAQWNITRHMIREDRLNTKIGCLLSRSYKINKIDEELSVGSTSRSVRYVMVEPSSADTSIVVSDDEVQKYYDEHKEFFVARDPMTEINSISLKVVPSSSDYDKAKDLMLSAVAKLDTSNTPDAISDVLRSYTTKFNTPSYLTEMELQSLGLNTTDLDFIKTADIGQVNNPLVVNNNYTIIKLTGKDRAVESVGLNIIILDSLNSTKTDSLLAELNSGKQSFAEMAKSISQDPSSANNGGKVSIPGQYGQSTESFTEAQLAQLGIQNAYENGFGKPFVKELGAYKAIMLLSDPKDVVDRYKFALINQPVVFSEETYNEKYAVINDILNGNKTFDGMVKAAEKEGLNVSRNTMVTVQTPTLLNIPSSRQIIRWALYADKGEISPSLYTCGTDYLVIAQVANHIEAGFAPVDVVKEQIRGKLLREKRAKDLAQKMTSNKKNSLEEYAVAYNVSVDSLVDVTYLVRQMGANFNGLAMSTAIGQVSEPFVSNDQVFVVQPKAEESNNEAILKSQEKQREMSTARQLSYRAFSQIIEDVKVEDNRGRFY